MEQEENSLCLLVMEFPLGQVPKDSIVKAVGISDDVSVSKRAIGGEELKVWFDLACISLEKLLSVVLAGPVRPTRGKIIIRDNEVRLEKLEAAELQEILESKKLLRLIKELRKGGD